MAGEYPFYNEPTHDTGAAITLTAANAGRTTATSLAEGRLIVDAVDKILLLEPRLIGLAYSNVGQ